MARLDRRSFLKLAGATAVAGAFYQLGLVGLDTLAAQRQRPPGPLSIERIPGT